MNVLFVFLYILQFSQGVEIIPLRPDIEYVNEKYISSLKVKIRRRSRRSPYLIYASGEFLEGVGNNFTMTATLYENLSGNFVPFATHYVYKVCDFLNNDTIIAPMWLKQMPKNITTCPIPPGFYVLEDFSLYVSSSYRLPLTFSAIDVTLRTDLMVNVTATGEYVLKLKTHMRLIQKPQYKQKQG